MDGIKDPGGPTLKLENSYALRFGPPISFPFALVLPTPFSCNPEWIFDSRGSEKHESKFSTRPLEGAMTAKTPFRTRTGRSDNVVIMNQLSDGLEEAANDSFKS